MIITSNTNPTPATLSQTHCLEFRQSGTLCFSPYPCQMSRVWSSFTIHFSMTPNIWNYCSKSTKTQHLNLNSPPTVILFSIGERFGYPLTTRFTSILLKEFHTTSLGGHIVFAKTIHHLQENFVWS